MPKHVIPFFDSSVAATVELMITGNKTLYFLEVSNIDATDAFVQLFDAAAAADVTLGTTTPTLAPFIPAGNATNRGAMDKMFEDGLDFQKGICYAVTTTATGNTAGATAAVLNAGYA